MKDKQSDNAKILREEAVKAGSFKSIGDVIPLPDKEDWNNIVRIINKFNKKQVLIATENGEKIIGSGRDAIVEIITDAKKEHFQSRNIFNSKLDEFQVVNKASDMRHIFELPEGLVKDITEVYPVMFTNKKHFAWFAKNFKELRLAEKY